MISGFVPKEDTLLWLNGLLILMLVQLSSLPGDLVNFDASWSPGLALFWCAASLILSFAWGRSFFQMCLKVYMERRRPERLDRYQRWGMEREVFGKAAGLLVLVLGVWGAISVGLTAVFAVPALANLGIIFDRDHGRFLQFWDTSHPGLGVWLFFVIAITVMGFPLGPLG